MCRTNQHEQTSTTLFDIDVFLYKIKRNQQQAAAATEATNSERLTEKTAREVLAIMFAGTGNCLWCGVC